MKEQEEIQKLIDRVKNLEKNEQMDLSSGEDLSVAIMNLISIEEHLFFTGSKTGKQEYFELLKQIREMRKTLLKRIIKNPDGEVWCISKHLLASSMRVMEVGTKYLGKGEDKEAQKLFKNAYELYNLFWGLNLDLVKFDDITPDESEEVKYIDDKEENPKEQLKETASIFDKLSKIIKKAVDCCKE